MAVYRDEAVVVSHRDFQEASRILHLITRYNGRVSAIARGVRRPTSRKSGSLEQFNVVKVALAEGRSLDVVTEVEVMRSFHILSARLDRAVAAYRMCELTDTLVPEREQNVEVFEFLVAGLESLLTEDVEVKVARRGFEIVLLQILGYWPEEDVIEPVGVRGLVQTLRGDPFGIHLKHEAEEQLWRTLDGVISDYAARALPGRLKTDRVLGETM